VVNATDLPALDEERPVDRAQPQDAVAGLEVAQPVALLVQVVAQALEQLGSAGLNHRLLAEVDLINQFRP
jgi:hypothetical protein